MRVFPTGYWPRGYWPVGYFGGYTESFANRHAMLGPRGFAGEVGSRELAAAAGVRGAAGVSAERPLVAELGARPLGT